VRRRGSSVGAPPLFERRYAPALLSGGADGAAVTRPLVYGAYGYTGELVARAAVDAGLDPVLGGRREDPLAALADDLGADHRAVGLGDLRGALDDVDVLLHCAGPFLDTYEPAVEACLATGTHYVDITGEIPVYEALADRDDGARDAGVMVLSGAGFDVVPSDCLGARLHQELPDADRLTLAFGGLGEISGGTARSAMRIIGDGVPVREGGELRTVPFGSRSREIDTGTGDGPRRMGIFPWGDVVTAHHTTGIPDIEVYAPEVMGLSLRGQRALGRLQPLLGIGPVRRALAGLAGRAFDGPDERERAEGSSFFWGEVTDGDRTVTGRVHTTESYQFTADSVVEVAERVLAGDAPPGYKTPAGAYGADLVTTVEGCRFEDVGEPGG
jgi:short subunit dehydrogenase-like uncharacterized protein